MECDGAVTKNNYGSRVDISNVRPLRGRPSPTWWWGTYSLLLQLYQSRVLLIQSLFMSSFPFNRTSHLYTEHTTYNVIINLRDIYVLHIDKCFKILPVSYLVCPTPHPNPYGHCLAGSGEHTATWRGNGVI